ncbi:MAG: hypothetical protein J3K34DRAFT_515857 [Monoraphidium minutum]|nr:MAG: hypothetical protein J3K34DRAFT_515857 [Monoraphidium minutum]
MMGMEGGGGGMVPDQLIQMLMISRLSTGSSTTDALVVMLLPLLLHHLLPWLKEFYDTYLRRQLPKAERHERRVAFTQRDSYSYSSDIDKEPPNHLLQAAILLYVNAAADLGSKVTEAEVQLRRVRRRGDGGNDGSSPSPRGGGGGSERGSKRGGGGEGGEGGEDGEASSSGDSWTSWCRPSGDELLEHLGVSLVPPEGVAVAVEPGLTLKRMEATSGSGDGGDGGGGGGALRSSAARTTTLVLEGSSAAQVDGFLSLAWKHFREERRKKEVVSREARYLYMPVLGRGGRNAAEAGGDRWTYKRYKLSDDKDFTSLFHPDKPAVLDLLAAFTHGTGKFAIQGYPQKLGFLLHGPPGTGKTSFIKALAAHTGRSLVSIPLGRVRTNQELMDMELMDMMFDQAVMVEGKDFPVSLPFSKVIFIFEDVDACGDIVTVARRREGGGGGGRRGGARRVEAAAAAGDDLVVEIAGSSGGGSDVDKDGGGGNQSRRRQSEGGSGADTDGKGGASASGAESDVPPSSPSSPLSSPPSSAPSSPRRGRDRGRSGVREEVRLVSRQPSLAAPGPEFDAAAAAAAASALSSYDAPSAAAGAAAAAYWPPARPAGAPLPAALGAGGWLARAGGGRGCGDDALNLAGLLNALDGVVDTPGRIVVFTSNHPERLDPALVRPGRINRKIYMGHMAAAEAAEMLRHWFGGGALEEGGPDAGRFAAAWADGALSPAALESMCAEHDDMGGLLAALEAHPALVAARRAATAGSRGGGTAGARAAA